jgi:hypothetical protein
MKGIRILKTRGRRFVIMDLENHSVLKRGNTTMEFHSLTAVRTEYKSLGTLINYYCVYDNHNGKIVTTYERKMGKEKNKE